jgi:hypothetical protein
MMKTSNKMHMTTKPMKMMRMEIKADDNKAYEDDENGDQEQDEEIDEEYDRINEEEIEDLFQEQREQANPNQHCKDEGQGGNEAKEEEQTEDYDRSNNQIQERNPDQESHKQRVLLCIGHGPVPLQ